MIKLSTGADSTLGEYLKLTKAFFSEDSEAVKFLEGKIAESPNGESEEVIVDEGQMVYLLGKIHLKGEKPVAAEPKQQEHLGDFS